MMAEPIVVREYARLTTSPVPNASLNEAQVSETAFDWLCELAGRFRTSGASLLQTDGRKWLRLDNYVGILESPCGQVIEILPKHHDKDDDVKASRKLLCKLIANSLDLPDRTADEASLSLYTAPLSEWVMKQFLLALDHLLKRGLRFDYLRIEEEQRYLRGQLDVVKQMRQPPGRQHFFHIRHDVFLPDRAENRLLKSALTLVCKATQDADNWRLAHELAGMLYELPESSDITQDFRQWRNDRLMAHYQPVKPWCELILYRQMPMAVAGQYRGISMLFPMEKLFENHVERCLRRKLSKDAELLSQSKQKSLCTFGGQPIFQLVPDLIIKHAGCRWVLDTKWKRLNSANRDEKFGLSQADFYQLFAYGHHYLSGKGEMALIYPKCNDFEVPLEHPFVFDDKLRLYVLPFDLDNDEILLPTDLRLPLIERQAAS